MHENSDQKQKEEEAEHQVSWKWLKPKWVEEQPVTCNPQRGTSERFFAHMNDEDHKEAIHDNTELKDKKRRVKTRREGEQEESEEMRRSEPHNQQ